MADGAGEASGAADTSGAETGKPAGEVAAATPAAKEAAAKQEARLLKLKINGREEEWPEDKVVAYAQKGRAADQKFEEAAKFRKEREEFEALMEKNPEKALASKLGDERFEKVAVDYLKRKLALKTASPEQRRIMELESKLKEREEKDQEEQEKALTEKRNKLVEQHTIRLDKEIPEALDSVGLTKSPYTISRMADLMIKARKNGWDVPTKSIAEMVKDEIRSHIQDLGKNLPDERLAEIYGEEIGERFSKARIARLANPPDSKSNVQASRKAAATTDKLPGQTNKMSQQEYDDYIEKVTKGEI